MNVFAGKRCFLNTKSSSLCTNVQYKIKISFKLLHVFRFIAWAKVPRNLKRLYCKWKKKFHFKSYSNTNLLVQLTPSEVVFASEIWCKTMLHQMVILKVHGVWIAYLKVPCHTYFQILIFQPRLSCFIIPEPQQISRKQYN